MPYQHGHELASTYAAARDGGYGFFASNVTQFDILVGLLRGTSRVGSDLVVQVNRETAAFYGNGDPTAGITAFGAYLDALADTVDIGVFCNVDHVYLPDQGDFLDACVRSGFPSSIMVDASDRSFEENVELTRDAVERVNEVDGEMLVEAELGRIAGVEGSVETAVDDAFYTDPEDAVEFVERTDCDLLAVSVGTQHGVASGRDLDVRPDVAASIDRALRDAQATRSRSSSTGLPASRTSRCVRSSIRAFVSSTRTPAISTSTLGPPRTSTTSTPTPYGLPLTSTTTGRASSRTATGHPTRRISIRRSSPRTCETVSQT